MDLQNQARQMHKILFLGENTDLFERCRGDIERLGDIQVTYETGSLSGINGRARTLADENDVIVFQTSGGAQDIAELKRLKAESGDRVFVALVEDDVPIARARDLIEAGASEIMPSPNGAHGPFIMTADHLVHGQAGQGVPQEQKGTVFSVAQSRGGIGGTTVAVNLAVALADLSQKTHKSGARNTVALLDFDLQFGNAGVFLDLEDNGKMFELMSSAVTPSADDIIRAAQTSNYGVDVLTAPAIIAPITAMPADRARAVIKAFAARYSHVVIDLPKVIVDWMEPVLDETDRLIMVSDLSVPCVRQAKRLMDVFHETNVTLPVDLVLNREKKTFLKSEAQRDAEKLLDLKVAAWIPENTKEERRSVDLGTPTAGRRSKGRSIFRTLGASLAKLSAFPQSTTIGR